MGEEKSVLRVGGLAGVLAGSIIVIAFIALLSSPQVAGLEESLATWPENAALANVTLDLFLVGLLLFIPFLAVLYSSLREPSRLFARIGLGTGVLAVIVLIFGLLGSIGAAEVLSRVYMEAATGDRPVVVAIYGGFLSLFGVGIAAGFLFAGLAFVAFGIAMRGSRDFGGGLAWLSVALGIIIVLFTFLLLAFLAFIAVAVFALVLGWKVYSLSRAA